MGTPSVRSFVFFHVNIPNLIVGNVPHSLGKTIIVRKKKEKIYFTVGVRLDHFGNIGWSYKYQIVLRKVQ
jgi:hypothetical protein